MAAHKAILSQDGVVITIYNLGVTLGNTRILHGISTTLSNGSVTVVLGQNGAGKSTLFKCLSRHITPHCGHITLCGKPLDSYSLVDLARRRAVLSQTNPVNFPFNAEEIVAMGRSPHASISGHSHSSIVSQALELVDAGHLKQRIVPTLSGGEQQRIQLARVLAQLWDQNNAYLFLDEPTAALDLKHQHLILQCLSTLAHKHGFMVCIIMHDLHLAAQYADCIILLKQGQLLACGEALSVLTTTNLQTTFDISRSLASQYLAYIGNKGYASQHTLQSTSPGSLAGLAA